MVQSVESSTGEPSCRPSCATPLVPQEQQCTDDWCSACRITLERISECLNFQIFRGGVPPDPHRGAATCNSYNFGPPKLKSPMTVWSPHQKGQIDTLESVLKLALRVCFWNWDSNYHTLLSTNNILKHWQLGLGLKGMGK